MPFTSRIAAKWLRRDARALLDAPSPSGSLFEEREWTDNTGSNTITANFIGIEGEAVTLKRNDNKTFTPPLSRLSQQDQELIRQHGSGSADAPSQADESSSNAVLFAEREWTERNASSKFRAAFIGMKGTIVTPKRTDGSTLKLRLVWFSQEDQDFILEHWNGSPSALPQ